MRREGSFVAEVFSGVNVTHVKAVPSTDGTQLGVSFLPPEGEPVSVIISYELLKTMVTEIASGAQRCEDRISGATPQPRLR